MKDNEDSVGLSLKMKDEKTKSITQTKRKFPVLKGGFINIGKMGVESDKGKLSFSVFLEINKTWE